MPVDPARSDDDYWHQAVWALTGYQMPKRGDLFDQLLGNQKIPLMKVEITEGAPPWYGAIDEIVNDLAWRTANSGWRIDSTDFVVPWYTTSSGADGTASVGTEVKMIRARITLLGTASTDAPPAGGVSVGSDFKSGLGEKFDDLAADVTWSNKALSQYSYGGGKALEQLYLHGSTVEFGWNDIWVKIGEAVDLDSFSDVAKAFDRAARFFHEQHEELRDWEFDLGRETAAWKGQAAGVFRDLLHGLARKYGDYAEQLPLASPSRSEYGEDIRKFRQALKWAVRDLYNAWSRWQLYTGNPLRWLHDVLLEVTDYTWDNNITKVRYHEGSGENDSSMFLVKKEGFTSGYREWGPLEDMATWKKIGEEAIRRWQDSVIDALGKAGKKALADVENAWNDAKFKPLTTTSNLDLESLYNKDKAIADAAAAAKKQKELEDAAKKKEEDAAKKAAKAEKDAADKEAKAEKDAADKEAKWEAHQKKLEEEARRKQEELEKKQDAKDKKQEEHQRQLEEEQRRKQEELERKQDEKDKKQEQHQREQEEKQERKQEELERKQEEKERKQEQHQRELEEKQERKQEELERKQEEKEQEQERQQQIILRRGEQEREQQKKEQEQERRRQEQHQREQEEKQERRQEELDRKQEQKEKEQEQRRREQEEKQERRQEEQEQKQEQRQEELERKQEEKEKEQKEYQREQQARQDRLQQEQLQRQERLQHEQQERQDRVQREQEQRQREQEQKQEQRQREIRRGNQLPGRVDDRLPSLPGSGDGATRLDPDGSLNRQFPDGTSTRIDPVTGEVTVTLPDGTEQIRDLDPGQSIRNPDGSWTTLNPDRSITTDFPDGSSSVLDPSKHTSTTMFPDGTTITTPLEPGHTLPDRPDNPFDGLPPGTGLNSGASPDTRQDLPGMGGLEEDLFDEHLDSELSPSGIGAREGGPGGYGAPGGPGGPPMLPMGTRIGGGTSGGEGDTERVRTVLDDGQQTVVRRRGAPRRREDELAAAQRGGTPTSGGSPFMPPMGGGQGGGGQQTESSDRERDSWVAEDDDVWGTDEGGAPAALGRD